MAILAFAGPDRGRIREAVRRLRSTVAKKIGEDPEYEQFYVGEDSMENVVTRLLSPGLFSPHFFGVVNGAESLSAAETKLFKSYSSKPGDNTTLVFLGQDPKASADKLSFLPKESITLLYEMSEGEKKGLIHGILEKRQVKIQPDALEFLCDLVSADSDDIHSQCDMLCNTLAVGKTVDLEAIGEFVYHSRQETVYTLFEILLEGNLAGSLECLHKIIQSQESEAIGVVLGLQWQYRSLLDLKDSGIQRPSYEDFRSRRIFVKRSQGIYQAALDRYSPADILGFTETLARYDQLLREARGGAQGLTLEMMVYELCQRRRIGIGVNSVSFFGT
jgi:DNA polymerase-3 subunit delta